MRYLDQAVPDAGGVALRCGVFTERPTTGLSSPSASGSSRSSAKGGGISSFIHLDDAAAATVLALEGDGAGICNIIDDEPAPMRVWLPVLADALGAKPPRRFPAGLRGCSRAKPWS